MKRLAAILLAAGASRRFADGEKLTAELASRPLTDWLFATVESLGLAQTIVVMRPDASDELQKLARLRGARVVVNQNAGAGVGASIAAGVAALKDVEGAFICPADMPLLTAQNFSETAAAFFEGGDADIAAPHCQGRRGHPVLFGKRHFPALRNLSGDVGAQTVIERAQGALRLIETDDEAVLFDVDAPSGLVEAEKLLALRARFVSRGLTSRRAT